MRDFLIFSGVLVALWFLVGLVKFLAKKLKRRATTDEDRKSVEEWVKDSAHYKKAPQGRKSGSASRRRR